MQTVLRSSFNFLLARCASGDASAADQLGINYNATAKGWMTATLFQQWLTLLNDEMRSAGRSIRLLIDNVSSHRFDETLSNVTLRMLPPNTTAFLQPLAAGIISSFKTHIAKVQH